MKALPREWQAAKNVLSLTPGNSDKEKYVLWAGLSLWILGGFGKMTGMFAPDPILWHALNSIVLLHFGRVWGKESGRLNDK